MTFVRSMTMRSVGALTTGFVLALLSGCTDGPDGPQVATAVGRLSPTAAPCQAYVLLEHGVSSAVVLGLRPRTGATSTVLSTDQDLQALAVDPRTGHLFALSGAHSSAPGTLYDVDVASGTLNPIMDVGYDDVHGLAARSDGTLWTWARPHGLVEIDVESRTVELLPQNGAWFDGLAWDTDGSSLYGVKSTTMSVYASETGVISPLGVHLPGKVTGLATRSDGLLVAAFERGTGSSAIDMAIVDPTAREVVRTFSHEIAPDFLDRPIRSYHVESVAWNPECGNLSPGGQADLIHAVEVSADSACSGDSVEVTVSATHPDSASLPVHVLIGDRVASSAHVQVIGPPGEQYFIAITAYSDDGYVDSAVQSVTLDDCSQQSPRPILRLAENRFHPGTVDFLVANAEDFGDGAQFVWDFGDGGGDATSVPYAAHSYDGALNATSAFLAFNVKVTVTANGQTAESSTTISIWNDYAFERSRGVLQPPVSTGSRLERRGDRLERAFTIRNVEGGAIDYDTRRVSLVPCDELLDPIVQPSEAYQLTVDGNETVTTRFSIPASSVPATICGVAVQMTGDSQAGIRVESNLFWDVAEHLPTAAVVADPVFSALLNYVAATGMSASANEITEEELSRLSLEGRINIPPPEVSQVASSNGLQQNGLRQKGIDPAEGDPCIPGSPSTDGLICSATDEFGLASAHIANALKGDAVLSGGCGTIGEILSRVAPLELYTHVGLMTRNYYQLRNSTASEDWLQKQTRDRRIDGLREDALNWSWPGHITQSVYAAYNGEPMVAPDGKEYILSPFGAETQLCSETHRMIVWQRVIRPPRDREQEVRAQLHAAADAFAAAPGHYRFYAYSEAELALNSDFNKPADDYWPEAEGSSGTVCSSSIWSAMVQSGIHLEGEIQPDEWEASVEGVSLPPVDAARFSGNDGVYFYTEAERLVAGVALWTALRNTVLEQEPDGSFFGTPTKVANQGCNCFAHDICREELGPAPDKSFPLYDYFSLHGGFPVWVNPGDGVAISPDGMLMWDGPERGGVYGTSERLAYRGTTWRRIYRWVAAPPGTGVISGTVVRDGVPQAGATVVIGDLPDSQFVASTDETGAFQFVGVPAGGHEVIAEWHEEDPQGLLFQGTAFVDLADGESETVEIVLLPPNPQMREVRVTITGQIKDDEAIGSDVYRDVHEFEVLHVNPAQPVSQFRWQVCVGDEVVVRADIEARYQENYSVDVRTTGVAWERRSCKQKDPFGRFDEIRNVAPGATEIWNVRMENDERNGGDFADLTFEVENRVEP